MYTHTPAWYAATANLEKTWDASLDIDFIVLRTEESWSKTWSSLKRWSK